MVDKKDSSDDTSIGHVLLESALAMAKKCSLQTLLLYVDGLSEIGELEGIDYSCDAR